MKIIKVAIGTDAGLGFRARLSLIVQDDDGAVLSDRPHSINVNPTDDIDEVRAAVEQHLAQPFEQSGIPGAPWPAIPDDEWRKAVAMRAIWHPAEVIADCRARAAEEQARQQAALEQAQADEAARNKAAADERTTMIAAAVREAMAQQAAADAERAP
jgi:hypothetical protein